MSVLRVMGTETEYGISVPGQPGANAMVTSSQIVNAYQAATAAKARRARWDFEEENPLRDARGFDLTREAADSSQLTDEDLGLANVILTNGGRLYVDHAHPEYSAPECTNPLSVVIWDKAGERVMAEAAAKAATVPGSAPIQLYKNNTDNKGASYGSHENYLMRRGTPAGSASAPTAAARASRSASAPTSSRSRSAWRPPSSGPSSTPGTSRTRTRRSTGGCT
jgi:hypothetical protein